MKAIFSVLLGVAFADNVWQYDYMIPEVDVNATSKNELGICYGSTTQWSTYPYMAALRYSSGSACCTASIVSLNPPVLLTAAHCNGCTGNVMIGCNNPSSCDGVPYAIEQFIQHPAYGQPTQFSNDIAVVYLQEDILFPSGVTAIEYAEHDSTIGSWRATGYGITQTGSIPTSLQTGTMGVIENMECEDIMRGALGFGNYIDETMVCMRGGSSGQEGVTATCSGDSGGPWTSTSTPMQYGVTSWGLQGSGTGCGGCNCCTGYPSVGANVAHFHGWIQGHIHDRSKQQGKVYNRTQSL